MPSTTFQSPLTFTRLLLRGLRHYGRVNLAVLLAAAVGVAVLAGALLVGHSMRQSLRSLATDRLGRVQWALQGEQYFRQALAAALPGAAPLIASTGAVTHAEKQTRAGSINVYGVTPAFWQLSANADTATASPLMSPDFIGLNRALAEELGAAPGDELIVRIPRPSAAHYESFLGRRENAAATLRVRIAGIVDDQPIAGFSLNASQHASRNLFVPLGLLQRRLEQPGRINLLLAPQWPSLPDWRLNLTLADLGLSLRPDPQHRYLSLESQRIFIPASLAKQVDQLAPSLQLQSRPVLSYLANRLKIGGRYIPYSMIAAVDEAAVREAGLSGLGDHKILLNEWAAEDLAAKAGDRLSIEYFDPAPGKAEFAETSATLTVDGILPLASPLADRLLTPDFPGIANADSFSAWDPPFPLDMQRIRPRDDEYWEKYRATPKGIVNLATGRRLWANRFGDATAIRLYPVDGAPMPDAATLDRQLAYVLDSVQFGLRLLPLREQALRAGQGSSDFGGLFIGFSLFVLVSAAMMLRILFSLGIEMRAGEWRLLRAVGFTPRQLRGLMMAEGMTIALLGGLPGLALGIGWAALMLHGLQTWWLGSIGAPFLQLHVDPSSLIGGYLGGGAIALLAIWRSAGQLSRQAARRSHFSGAPSLSTISRPNQFARFSPLRRLIVSSAGCLLLFLGIVLSLIAGRTAAAQQSALFFTSGFMLLFAAFFLFDAWLKKERVTEARAAGLTLSRLGILAARRQPGRSLLVAGLMASAAFLIVAVSANRPRPPQSLERQSGNGGFALLAESSLPLFAPLSTAGLTGGSVYRFRLRPGDDASCRNLYQTNNPRILGAPPAFVKRGGFSFAAVGDSLGHGANPWQLLNHRFDDGAIPVIGDYNTVMWLMHSGVGKDFLLDGRKLRFVALLKGSILQSELIVSDENFKRLFPQIAGYRYFLIEAPAHALGNMDQLAQSMESAHEDAGLDVVASRQRLAELLSIENAYLSAFQGLGGFGLLLGTLGLALALARNLLERRRELALLRALGYRRIHLFRMVFAEHAFLLLTGLLTGAAAALVTVIPALRQRAGDLPLASLSLTLAFILVFGLAALALAAALTLRAPMLKTLREE